MQNHTPMKQSFDRLVAKMVESGLVQKEYSDSVKLYIQVIEDFP